MRIVLSIIVTICCMSGELPAYADRYPAGLSNHRFNGSNKPATVAGITTLHINDHQCSDVDYGDGRGENDCYNGNIRSVLSHQPQAVLNENWEYRFDIWVDPSFSYPGFYNDHARDFMPGSFDSRLRIASWEGPFIHNFLYAVKVDAKNGISFLGKECQSKSSFGEWVAFSMNWLGE